MLTRYGMDGAHKVWHVANNRAFYGQQLEAFTLSTSAMSWCRHLRMLFKLLDASTQIIFDKK